MDQVARETTERGFQECSDVSQPSERQSPSPVECPSCGQRVSGGRGLEIHRQKSCRELKTQRDQEKHNQKRLREQTGKTGWICGSLPCCVHAQGRVEETHDKSLRRALQTTQCLRPQMFAKETSKKEQRDDKGQQEEGPKNEAQLVKMIVRLTLQH